MPVAFGYGKRPELGGPRVDDDRIDEVIRKGAHRNHSALLRGMRDVTQKRVAELIGVSATTLSDMKDDHLKRFAALVAACGLKMVPVTEQVYDEAVIGAIKTLAAIGLGRDLRRDGEED